MEPVGLRASTLCLGLAIRTSGDRWQFCRVELTDEIRLLLRVVITKL